MTVLGYLDYADNIGLLSSKHQDAQQKAGCLSKTANTQVLRKSTRVNDPVMIDGKDLEDVEEFTYFDNKVTTTGD